jgi:hypothetical protein
LGFRCGISESNKKVPIDIRAARLACLRNISRHRNEGRPIITLHTHKKEHALSDAKNAGLLAPVSKGRVVIVHAGSENSFIPNALLMFESRTKSSRNEFC